MKSYKVMIRVAALLTGGIFLAVCPDGDAARIKKAPRKSAPIYGSSRRVKPAPPPSAPKPNVPFATPQPTEKVSGIELVLPPIEGELPMFRVVRPDGSPAEGAAGQWSPLMPEEPKEAQAGPIDTSNPLNAPGAQDLSAAFAGNKDLRQPVPLLPGSYTIQYSYPVPGNPLEELSGSLLWSQPVRVKKEAMSDVKMLLPTFPVEAVTHQHIKRAGPMNPFYALFLEPVGGVKDKLTSRWEHYAIDEAWPDSLRVALLAGKYRMVMGAAGGGAYSSLRYEFPEPITIDKNGEIPIQRPKFNTLRAEITDRKGTPLAGVPLMLMGTGETMVVIDSGKGSINVRVPVDRYTVRALVFNEKGSREVTLDKKLDMNTDQERKWKAPTTTIDFGLTLPAPVEQTPAEQKAPPPAGQE